MLFMFRLSRRSPVEYAVTYNADPPLKRSLVSCSDFGSLMQVGDYPGGYRYGPFSLLSRDENHVFTTHSYLIYCSQYQGGNHVNPCDSNRGGVLCPPLVR